jgi:hypothetical protein
LKTISIFLTRSSVLFVVVVRRPLEPHKVRQPKKEAPAIKEESEGGGGGGGVFLSQEREI